MEPPFEKTLTNNGKKLEFRDCWEYFALPENPVWYGKNRNVKHSNRFIRVYGRASETGTVSYRYQLGSEGHFEDDTIDVYCGRGGCEDFVVYEVKPIMMDKYDHYIHIKSRPLKGLYFYMIYIDSYYEDSQLITRVKYFGISILVCAVLSAKIFSLLMNPDSRKYLTWEQYSVWVINLVLIASDGPMYSTMMLDYNWFWVVLHDLEVALLYSCLVMFWLKKTLVFALTT